MPIGVRGRIRGLKVTARYRERDPRQSVISDLGKIDSYVGRQRLLVEFGKPRREFGVADA